MTALCPAHGAPIVAPCARCGVFLCSLETRPLDDATYCADCVVRPEVDPLTSYRARFWGRRRDPWSWSFGANGALLFVVGVILASDLKDRTSLFVIGLVTGLGALQLAWFFKRRWARYALPAAVLVAAPLWVLSAIRAGNGLSTLPAALFACACMASAFSSIPSRLFFELEVPREKLRSDWQRYRTNWPATFSVLLAVGGISIWFLALLALVCGVVALGRTRQPSTPPIRGKWVAIAGIVLSGNILLTHAVMAWAQGAGRS